MKPICWRTTWVWAFWTAYANFWLFSWINQTGWATYALIAFNPLNGLSSAIGVLMLYVPFILLLRLCRIDIFSKEN